MEFLLIGIPYFLAIIVPLIVIHELGHYWAARACGVKVETFSVGFGPELFGFTDKTGTRWRFSAIPLGGYVKMLGDMNAASAPDGGWKDMPDALRAQTLHAKPLLQRAFVVAAGPFANFILAVLLFFVITFSIGQVITKPIVGLVQENSAAERAGVIPGDTLLSLGGRDLQSTRDAIIAVNIAKDSQSELIIKRNAEQKTLFVTPEKVCPEDRPLPIYRIGVSFERGEYQTFTLFQSVAKGFERTVDATQNVLNIFPMLARGEIQRKDLGGLPKISAFVGSNVKERTWREVFWTMLLTAATLSVMLGTLNLLPIPVLDGGHLAMFAYEGIVGRPLPLRVQERIFFIGFMLIIGLTLLVNVGDIFDLSQGNNC